METNTKHTAGNWQLWEMSNGGHFLTNDGQLSIMSGSQQDENAKRVCQVDAQREDVKKKDLWTADDPERLANAKLIAAAPKLLTMCILTLEDILSDAISDNEETRQLAIDNLTAAIKQATY